jgi:hypothetical protein
MEKLHASDQRYGGTSVGSTEFEEESRQTEEPIEMQIP